MKICSVVGARPQFVKAAAVSRRLRALPGVREVLIHTGQHYDDNMSRIFFDELDIPAPDVNLEVGSGSHGAQTARMLEGLEEVFSAEQPVWVVIYGDTNSTLAAALAASKLHIPIAHVEAGLRSFNRWMPEEINRIVADALSDLLFAPTETAQVNLLREGVAEASIHLVGDVMFEVAIAAGERAARHSRILEEVGLIPDTYDVCTIHRAENTDDSARLRTIFEALISHAKTRKLVVPIHPRTRRKLEEEGLWGRASERLILLPPVGYLDFARLVSQCRSVITDSGGLQKEAFFHRRPCFTIRDQTEWVELVQGGWNRLVPVEDPGQLAAALDDFDAFSFSPIAPYGSGDAAARIVKTLMDERRAAT